MTAKPSYQQLQNRVRQLERQVAELRNPPSALALLAEVMKFCPVMVVCAEADGLIRSVNPRFTQQTGLAPADVLGTPLTSLSEFPLGDKADIWVQLESNRSWQGTLLCKTAGGQLFDETVFLTAITDESGTIFGYAKISERNGSSEQTVESWNDRELGYQSILALAPDAITISRISDGHYLEVNEAFCQRTGYSEAEALGRTVFDLKLYADPSQRERLIKPLLEHGRVDGVEMEFQAKDGSALIELVSARRVRFKGEDCMIFVSANINALKQAQQELEKSEQKFRNILETMEEGYYEVDLEGNYTYVNEATCRLYGYTSEEFKQKNYRDLVRPESRKQVFEIYNSVYKTGHPATLFDLDTVLEDGTPVIIESSAALILDSAGNPAGFRGVCRDVTEKRKLEAALRESEEKYRSILETMEEGYYEVDLTGSFTFVNDAECRIHQLTAEEMTRLNNRHFSTPETARRVYTIYNKVYRTGVPAKVIDYEIIREDGTRRFLETSASLMKDASGRPIGFRGISRDITERKKAEAALRESEEKYRHLVQNAHEAIFILQDEMIKFPNGRTETLTGYTAAELTRMSIDPLIHPDDREEVIQRRGRNFDQEQPTSTDTFRIMNKAMETLWVELNAVQLSWEGHPATLCFLKDISLQKRMETQLLQAQKMEAIGTLAGGIAHDFNNLLMGVQGNASLALLEIKPDDPGRDKIENIEELVKAGTELTKQLLGVARGGKYEVRPTDPNRLVETSADIFARTKREIRIHKYFQPGIWTVEVDRSQIEQVLFNLYINAWHAMPEGGDLYLETRNIHLDEYYVRPYGIPSGRYVKISVTDNGMGMDEETRQRVFDPFFTTKEIGRGTGLGLASAYGIISNHNGIINLYTEKGKGATFNIYLPVSEKDPVKETRIRETVSYGNQETILFVDDEEMIVGIGDQFLQRLGYRVMTARSGAEAIETYRKNQDRIALVILDMIMPEMGGGETFDRLKAINPEVKVLLSSGYSINGQAKLILERGCRGFLQKPFDLVGMSRKIRQILDSP